MSGVPYTFGNATTTIALSNLDVNFATPVTIGNTTVGLGNTVTTLGNVTLAGATVSGGTANGVVYLNTSNIATANASVLAFDGSNLGVGVTPSAWASPVQTALQFKGGASFASWGSYGGAYTVANAFYNGTNWKYLANNLAGLYVNESGVHAWSTAASGSAGNNVSFIQAMTLDNSGNLLVGTTSANAKLTSYASSGQAPLYVKVYSNGDAGTFYANASNSIVGSVTVNSSTVAYNTSSDRRLKSNITDLTNSGTVIDSLKPRAFTWISDNSADAGFIADEFQQVLPKAVTGQPNATKEEEYEVTPAVKDSMGNITTPAVMGTRTVPVYQMIDASQPELIAYLVAEVQSLRARLKAANIA